MFLVLCSPQDLSALWAHEHLRTQTGSDVQLVTSGVLAAALGWDHRLSPRETSLRIRLADKREIDSARIDAVLNRLVEAPIPHWSGSMEEDRLYVQQEMTAFYLSWLHGLPCPVFNPPTPQGLCGAWRQESEWAMLAGEAGLPTPAYEQSTRSRDDDPASTLRLRARGAAVYTAIVFQGTVTGLNLPRPLQRACCALAELCSTPLLGVEFTASANGALQFAGATPMPDLRLGGRGFLEILKRAFARAA
ncbi:hypothetical protein DB347_03000 [Opitutaceae bacterium EW11]|nr:hypothetical protein DB347_03000 [Opitutaceae bacterium EW11]